MTGEAGRTRAPAWAWGVGALVLVSLTGAVLNATKDKAAPRPGVPRTVLAAGWVDGSGSVSANGVARGSIEVTGAVAAHTDLAVTLADATFATIPRQCLVSDAKDRLSWVTSDGRTLHCTLPGTTVDAPLEIKFSALADNRADGFVTGTAAIDGAASMRLADRPVSVGVKPETREFRLLSSPDFTNADVADLRRGGANFDPTSETNGINGYYETSLDTVLNDWASKKPDDITVAGDLVDGHWGQDTDNLQVFGPVGTERERRAAVTRAGDVYYAQWAARFRAHGLTRVFPAMGDHEYGDNDWPRWKLNLYSTFQNVWEKHFTRLADGRPRFADRPRGVHEFSAYAWRPRPDVQMVTLDEFTRGPSAMHRRVDKQQQAWLIRVLKKARADGVRWVLVQGHMPILGPVREGASSGLMYDGGQRSALWRIFKKYGVDVYLCGEVHDVTAIQRDGVLQISHGGIFQYGRLNYLVADFYPNHLDLKVFDYDFHRVGEEKLWETRDLIPADVVYEPDPGIIGAAQLWRDDRLTRVGGALAPYLP
jgi:hypothetical protein